MRPNLGTTELAAPSKVLTPEELLLEMPTDGTKVGAGQLLVFSLVSVATISV